MKVKGFPPILPDRPRILILGTMPSIESLRQKQYYAHPHNAFWKIMGALLGFDPAIAYPRRVAALRRAGIALWDVLRRCERSGSLDAAIVRASEEPNAIAAIIGGSAGDGVAAVFLNGGKAATLFRRHVCTDAPAEIIQLPSTSPANARLTFEQKLAAWNTMRRYL